MTCPHCQEPLTPDEIRRLNAQLSASLRSERRGGRRPALTPAQRKRAKRMLAEGRTQTSVARELGVSQPTISKLARS